MIILHYSSHLSKSSYASSSSDLILIVGMIVTCPIIMYSIYRGEKNDGASIIPTKENDQCIKYINNKRGLCVLWNPSIQKAITLPKPNIGFRKSLHQSVGFGYDPMSDDYKLVRLVYTDTDYDFKPAYVPPLVEIYTLRTGIWRSITAPSPPYITNMWSSSVFAVFMNGVLHWPAHTPRCEGAFRNVIVSFNMKDEALGEVGMPKSLQELEDLNVTLALVNGLLALVPCNEFGNEASHAVWVMKEYGVAESWTKLFDVRIGGFDRVIGFTKRGEVLVSKAERLFSF